MANAIIFADLGKRTLAEGPAVGLPPKADCKTFAIALSGVSGLIPVRGYALFGGGFTEHWWNHDSAGNVVDATGLAAMADSLIDIDSGSDSVDDGIVCMAFVGECHLLAECAWCRSRSRLEDDGYERAGLGILRPVLGHLIRETASLRFEVEALKLAAKASVPT